MIVLTDGEPKLRMLTPSWIAHEDRRLLMQSLDRTSKMIRMFGPTLYGPDDRPIPSVSVENRVGATVHVKLPPRFNRG